MLTECIEYLENRSISNEAQDESRILPKGVERGSYEVLIVDDGSKDDTSKVALELAKKLYDRFGGKRGEVKVASLRKNRGKGGATKHVRSHRCLISVFSVR